MVSGKLDFDSQVLCSFSQSFHLTRYCTLMPFVPGYRLSSNFSIMYSFSSSSFSLEGELSSCGSLKSKFVQEELIMCKNLQAANSQIQATLTFKVVKVQTLQHFGFGAKRRCHAIAGSLAAAKYQLFAPGLPPPRFRKNPLRI